MEDQHQNLADEPSKLAMCESLLGYEFTDRSLLLEALTHASGASHRLLSNERLEFLGDAILGFLVCDELFARFPKWDEGELTRVKSAAVSRTTCAKMGKQMGLAEVLFVGRGITGGRSVPKSLLSNAVESLIAAIYLDGGLDSVRKVFLPLIERELEEILDGQTESNYKSALQHWAQRNFGEAPQYQLIDEKGPDHDKCFLVAAAIGERMFTPAWGNNKKKAEQRAACNALMELTDSEVGEEPE